MDRFVREWLGALMNYDAIHCTQLVLTLREYLECGGNYDSRPGHCRSTAVP